MNSEESVERLRFAGRVCLVSQAFQVGARLCSLSTTGTVQLWSLAQPRGGVRCGRVGLRHLGVDGHLVDVLYEDCSGRAQLLTSHFEGRLALYHLNLEGASYTCSLEGHKGLVRTAAPYRDGFLTGGEDGLLCCWRP